MSYMQTHTHHSFHDELRERAKLEGHHLSPDDEHLSQPSTMHSLGNLEDHFSPIDGTPSSASKAGQVGQHLKQEVKQQASQIKSMLFRTFGEEVDTYRDNSPDIKQQVSKINEQIKQLPKREEQVVESQGHGDSKEGLKEMSNQASGKISELMDNIYRHGERLREFGEKSGEDSDSVDPARDLSEKSKEQLNKLNQDIKQLPRKGEQIVEGNGRAKEKEPSKDTNSKSNSNDLWDIAFHKIEEMKLRAQQKGQEFKQQAQSIAQKASEHHDSPSHQEHHHHLSVGSQSFQPTEHSKVLAETVQEVLKDSSVPLIEKVEEFENEWKHTHEQPEKKEEEDSQLSLRKPQSEHMKEIPAQIVQEIEKKIESHREKAEEEIPEKKEEPKEEKAEVEKVKEREPLLDKVLHRIHTVSDNIHNTVESFRSAFKIEERAPESEVEQPKKREPLIDKVFNKVHAVSDNIHHTVEDIRDAIHVEARNKDQNIEEKPKASSIPQQEIAQEGSHLKQKITERIHNVTDIISHNIETVKSRIANSVENVKGRLHIRRSRDNEGFHKVTEGFSKSVKDYTYETKHFKPYKSVNPFQALVDENEPDYESDEDVVKESLVIKMKQRFMNGMNYIKSKLAFKRKGSIKKVKQEQEKEKQSLKKQFRQGLQILSGKISQNVEGVKRALRFRKDISLPEESPVEDLSPVREEAEIQGEAQVSQAAQEKTLKKSKSLKRSKKMKKGRKLENKTAQKQENWEEFHEIDSGFSKSVAEFERERRGKPVISVNPFDSLSAQNLSQSTRKVRKIEQPRPKKQVLKEKKVDNVQNQEKFHEISHGFSESVANFKRELRGAPLISNNPFSSLITRNVKKVQKKGKALIQKAKRTLRKSKDVSSEDKENIITPIA